MFLGRLPWGYPFEEEEYVEGGLTLVVRQLAEDTLVAVVEMLLALELL